MNGKSALWLARPVFGGGVGWGGGGGHGLTATMIAEWDSEYDTLVFPVTMLGKSLTITSKKVTV